jgi:hypothetical protein
MAESIATRALALAERRETMARDHAARGNLLTAARLTREAQEARELAALAKVAEEHVRGYEGPSRASNPPPPMPEVISEIVRGRVRRKRWGWPKGKPRAIEVRP